MNKTGFTAGIATGLLVGAAAAIMIDPISDKQKRRIKRKTTGVFKSIGSVIDTAVDLMK